mmetsp:Transcript_9998/g.21086  ORF Transcript_9998/g.21086 Transcript_9998/m.21086 type:complete len:690 (-) Transcript_9998:247-2316(-)
MDAKEEEEKGGADTMADAKDLDDGPASPSAKPSAPDVGDEPPTGLLQGYNQTYLIWKTNADGTAVAAADAGDDGKEDDQGEQEVLFRCGNWCYTGHVVLSKNFSLSDLPVVIPLLQRQQSRLHYYCNADCVPEQSNFHRPMSMLYEAAEFAAAELSSAAVSAELERLAGECTWLEEDSQKTFFEMKAELPEFMDNISVIASKTYARGLVFITVYFEGSFYISIADGEGDQPLLDVKFPDVSHHGQGVALSSAREKSPDWFVRLMLWHSMPAEIKIAPPPTRNLSTDAYMQMYVVMRPRSENGGFAQPSAYREVLFRFGSWCYGGSVQLTPAINLADIPHVIPALRMQQSRLEFVYSADQVPATSPFSKPMDYVLRHAALMESEIEQGEEILTKLVQRLTDMGLGDSISAWLEGDASQSFFEFQLSPGDEALKAMRTVELCASKCYYASGVVLVTIFFQNVFYVVMSDASTEQPLLDSKFPDVSSKGRGYQLRAYPEGVPDWQGLRKVSVWQTSAAMETEIANRNDERLAKLEAARAAGGEAAAAAVAVAEERQDKAADDELDIAASEGKEAAEEEAKPTAKPAEAEAKGEPKSSTNPTEAQPKATLSSPDSKAAGDNTRQNLGAFHRLAPMQGLKGALPGLSSGGGDAPWDAGGKPKGLQFGNASAALGSNQTSPFGKGALEFPKRKPL